jgi:exosortase
MNKTLHKQKKNAPTEKHQENRPSLRDESPLSSTTGATWQIVAGVAAVCTVLWAYWPTLAEMVHKWNTMPDYSHGYLVLPLALLFLWSRRESFPSNEVSPSWWGGIVLAIAVGLRILAGRYYLLPLDGWTMPITMLGVVWMLYGTAVIKWSWPAIVFLWFMVPIPYSAELWLRVPLQAVATRLGTAMLIMLGQPALAEGNVIYLGDHTLFVEEACSGMRIFVGMFALAFAFVLFSKWSWWQKALVLIATLPVAIIANVMRIVVTGLLYQHVSTDAGQKFSHDVAGFVMIPFAAALLWLFLVYLDRLFPRVQEVRVPATLWSTSATES